ncbi:MAG: hypothetical protein ACOYEV_12180 [Candidatus Nanopelagicales bacterium]
MELCERLAGQGWTTGLLREKVPAEPLVGVAQPVLVVVDYADGRGAETAALLQVLADRPAPSVAVLTGRSLQGKWLADILEAARSDGQALVVEELTLPAAHPNPGAIYSSTSRALSVSEGVGPSGQRGADWTTLDYVMAAWLTSKDEGAFPVDRSKLYELVLAHEAKYWAKVCRDFTGIDQDLSEALRQSAAVLALGIGGSNVDSVLMAVHRLTREDKDRSDVARALQRCLAAGPGQPPILRPDPVADHLMLTEFSSEPPLLFRALDARPPDSLRSAVEALARAGSAGDPRAARLIGGYLVHASQRPAPGSAEEERDGPPAWPVVAEIAVGSRGAAEQALFALLGQDNVVPAEGLSEFLPFAPLGPNGLALAVEERRLKVARESGGDVVPLLLRVSAHRRLVGDRGGALTAIDEAVGIPRELVGADRGVFLPDLAGSLNNQARMCSGVGDGGGALTAIDEAVGIRRGLVGADRGAFLPNLVRSITVLASILAAGAEPDLARAAWASSVAAVSEPILAAEIQAGWAHWTARQQAQPDAVAIIVTAAQHAETPPGDLPSHLVSRARLAVRGAAAEIGSLTADLPAWAVAELPEPTCSC